jgi:hypothetical protein
MLIAPEPTGVATRRGWKVTMHEQAVPVAQRTRAGHRSAVVVIAPVAVAAGAVLVASGLVGGSPAWAQTTPGVPTTKAAVTTTTLNANAGDTGNATTGTIVFIIVTAVIVIAALLIFLQARSNRLKASG